MNSRRFVPIYCTNEQCRKTTIHEKLEGGKLRCTVCKSVKVPKQS